MEREALKLLDEALAEAEALKLAENRLWVQSLAVAALWRHDEARARTLLAALGDELKRLAAEPQTEENRQRHWARGQLRQETARMLAARDPALARAFLNATRPPADSFNQYAEPQFSAPTPARRGPDDARQLEQAATERLAAGYGYDFWALFERLRKVDREAAARVAAKFAGVLRAEPLAKFADELYPSYAAFRLLEIDERVVRPRPDQPPSPAAARTPLLGPAARRDLLVRLADAALAAVPRLASSNPQQQYNARSLLQGLYPHLPDLKRLAPALEAKVRAATAEMRRGLRASEQEQFEINYLRRNGSVEELIEAARRPQTSAHEGFYSAITTRLVAEGRDLQPVRQLITEQSADAATRQRRLDRVTEQAVYELTEAGRLDEALRLLDAGEAGERNVELLLGVAGKLAEAGDAQAALKLAASAEAALTLPIRSPRQASAVAALMRLYARAAPARNFEWLEGLSEQLNGLVRALTTLGDLDDVWARAHSVEGELLLGGSDLFRYPVTQYLKHLAPLAREDFARARRLAESFTSPEVRALARLYAAGGVLIEPDLRDES
jgi:hypothetical protein